MTRLLMTTALLAPLALTPMPAFAVTQWNVQPDPKAITWEGVASGKEVFTGSCAKFDAKIAFDPADLPHSSVVITIDMNACKTGDGEKDAQLPQNDWFNIPVFPNSTFAAKSFSHGGGNKYVADGTLTMKGVTKKVTLPFTLDIAGDKVHVVGQTTLQRLAFGVGEGAQFSSPDVVKPDVKVKIDLHATRK